MFSNYSNNEGFTLVELILVIAILVIIAIIAIPSIIGAVDDARKIADISNAKVIAKAVGILKAENDGHAWETYSDTNALKISKDLGSGSESEKELYKKLNHVVAKPKYKGVVGTDNFYVVLSDDIIYIYIANDEDIKNATNKYMVYPTVNTNYSK